MNEAVLEEDYAEPLFGNVNKAIENGAFTALDAYMEKDIYWKNNQYHLPLLEAGRYENRQYVFPLSCIYYVYLGKESETFQGGTLGEWMEEHNCRKNLTRTENLFFGVMELMCARWQQPSLNYEHKGKKTKRKYGEMVLPEVFQCRKHHGNISLMQIKFMMKK